MTLICAWANAHCPCSGKPCDPSRPCGPCAQEQAQEKSRAKLPEKAPEEPIIKAIPTLLKHPKAYEYLATIQAIQETLQEKLSARIAEIEQAQLPIQPQPKPSPASIISMTAQSSPASNVQENILSAPASPNIAAAQPAHTHEEKTELEWSLIKSISAVLTPLITAYPTERLIPADPEKVSLDEQLEQMHTIATFVTKLKTKLELLTPEAREFIKTASFAGNPIARMLARNLLSLQSFFESQLASYKQVKPQSTLVKELKKLTSGCAKEVDSLCKELLHA